MNLKKAKIGNELKHQDLKWICDTSLLDFETTNDVKPIEGIVGQERALKALKVGVDLKSPGYNIFITGLSGTGKFTTIKMMLETIASGNVKLNDYAYVNNFQDEDRPTLLKFPAGKAVEFKKHLSNTIKFLQEKIPIALSNEPFISKKKQIITEFNQQQQKLLSEFEDKLKEDNFSLGQVKDGSMVRPEVLFVFEGEPYFIHQLPELIHSNKITNEQVDQIIIKYASYQEELQNIFRENLKHTQEVQERIYNLETESVDILIKLILEDLKKKYKTAKIKEWIDQLHESILENLDVFKGAKPSREASQEGFIIDYLKEYEVNIVLDNSQQKKVPVIVETSPTYNNLFGTIEKFNDGRGGWLADFTRIKGGSLLRANGGYIIINATDAFLEPGVWKTLKRVLLYGQLEIQDFANVYQFSPSVLKPEPIDIDVKVILIGSNYIYSILSAYEDDFNKIFKVKADFDYEMQRTDKAITEYAMVIKKLIAQENLLEFDKTAIAKIIEYGARYAGEKNKLTTRFAYIADLTRESSFWAKQKNQKYVFDFNVTEAYESSKERHGLYESKVSEMIKDGTILIDTSGEKIGTVNGLAVYESGHYAFGKPTRITASVALGNGSIINVEREAGLSGNTHNKGVLIITGYFKETFGREIPLSFTASIVFEQGYGMIDGDSASIAEIAALISSISKIPIKQSIAVTGSIDQKGNVQPIGGVNEKIEGFFDTCKMKGLNGKQGVIIPIQNVKDLMLKDEVIDAVKNKLFHIYSVSKVEEAIEILTGIKCGVRLKNNKFEENTVYSLVEKELISMKEKTKPQSDKNSNKKRKKL